MKRGKKAVWIYAFVLAVLLIPFVNAQPNIDVARISGDVVNFFKNIFGPIFQAILGVGSIDDYFFAKVLMLILLVMVIQFALEKSKIMPKKQGLRLLIALIISVLAIRYLPESDLIKGILLPYGTLGVAMLTFIPFFIYFFFVHRSVAGTFARRMAWVVYGLAFLILTILRWNDISGLAEWIYIAGLMLVVGAFMFDEGVHKLFRQQEAAAARERLDERLRNSYRIRIGNLNSAIALTPPGPGRDAMMEERDGLLASLGE